MVAQVAIADKLPLLPKKAWMAVKLPLAILSLQLPKMPMARLH